MKEISIAIEAYLVLADVALLRNLGVLSVAYANHGLAILQRLLHAR